MRALLMGSLVARDHHIWAFRFNYVHVGFQSNLFARIAAAYNSIYTMMMCIIPYVRAVLHGASCEGINKLCTSHFVRSFLNECAALIRGARGFAYAWKRAGVKRKWREISVLQTNYQTTIVGFACGYKIESVSTTLFIYSCTLIRMST